jgi:flagellar assembly factor FliW
MHIDTTRFGPIEIDSGDVIHFPEGLLGLPSCRNWVLLADAENNALAWMQSTDRAEIALGVVSPRRFVPCYQMRVARGPSR